MYEKQELYFKISVIESTQILNQAPKFAVLCCLEYDLDNDGYKEEIYFAIPKYSADQVPVNDPNDKPHFWYGAQHDPCSLDAPSGGIKLVSKQQAGIPFLLSSI